MRIEKQCGAVANVFPVLRGLVEAFAATGMHAEAVQKATSTLAEIEASHKTFTSEQLNVPSTLAVTLGTLKDELKAAATGGASNSNYQSVLSLKKCRIMTGSTTLDGYIHVKTISLCQRSSLAYLG